MPARIDREIIEAFVQCKTRGFLRLTGQQGIPSDYELLLAEVRDRTRQEVLDRILPTREPGDLPRDVFLTADLLRRGQSLILGAMLEDGVFAVRLDGLQRVDGHSGLGDFYFVPVLFHGGRVHREQKILLEIQGHFLGRLQDRAPGHAVVWSGGEVRAAKVRLGRDPRATEQVLRCLKELGQAQPPRLVLNDHCQRCEFRERCRNQAIDEDNLSLLRGMNEKEIRKQARKGIFALNQLAHTFFRPRRKPRKDRQKPCKRQHALHAMAIRDKRVYVLGSPAIPSAPTRIYVDLEGKPDESFVYLIGMTVVRGDTEQRHSYWADGKEEEQAAFERFLAAVRPHEPFVLFCYGGYELAFFRRMRKRANDPDAVDRLLASAVNVLSLVHSHLYFPCYSNGLKDVGGYLGHAWSEPNASGLQSLVWRARWEAIGHPAWRRKLETYNQEDCAALRRVVEFVDGVIARTGAEAIGDRAAVPPVVRVQELKDDYPPERSWGAIQFVHPDFERVNGCAYFDYQRERVYVRSSEAIRRSQRRDTRSKNRKLRCSKEFTLTSASCPSCKGTTVVSGLPIQEASCPAPRLKRAFDLVRTPTGLRRSVVHCRSSVHKCLSCGSIFVPEEHQRLDKHFHGLKAWAMYQHVAHRIDLGAISTMIEEFFGVRVFSGEMCMIKALMARYYGPTQEQSLRAILSGNLLHVDETEVVLDTGKATVWVFTTLEEVVYLFRPNREAGFLHEMLKDFRGVLVSDFYAGYDSLPCPQQKCLIHLIRDMNQELLANPFDEELRSVTQPFGKLVRAVVATVDEHGLRRKHLQRHSREVTGYFDHLAGQTFVSTAAQSLQARLMRCRERLFTFAEHDGVPWNNNNAENAIKRFAYYREVAPPPLHEEPLRHYLLLLGLYQTCRYKGVNFLRFLMSGELDLEYFCRKGRAREPLPAMQLYPGGFIPPHFSSKQRKASGKVIGDVQAVAGKPIAGGGVEDPSQWPSKSAIHSEQLTVPTGTDALSSGLIDRVDSTDPAGGADFGR